MGSTKRQIKSKYIDRSKLCKLYIILGIIGISLASGLVSRGMKKNKESYDQTINNPKFKVNMRENHNYTYEKLIMNRTTKLLPRDAEDSLLNQYNTSISQATGIYIEDERLYLGDKDTGKIHILDIQQPNHPILIGSFQADFQKPLIVHNKIIFLSASDGFEIWNGTDPENVNFLGFYSNVSSIRDIAIWNNYAFLTSNSKLEVVNITDLKNPHYLNHIEIWCSSLMIKEECAYILGAQELGGYPQFYFLGLNITDPSNKTGTFQFTWERLVPEVGDLFIENDILVATDPIQGFYLFNIENPFNVISTGSNESFDFTWEHQQIFLEKGNLYIPTINGKISIYNVNDPSFPTFVKDITVNGTCDNIWVESGIIYVADGTNGLKIIDSEIREGCTDLDRDGLFGIDETIYWNTDPLLADSDFDGCPDGTEIEQGTDPNEFQGQRLEPELVGYTTNNMIFYRDVEVYQNYIYVITEEGGLEVHQISIDDQNIPKELDWVWGDAPHNHSFTKIKVQRNYLFLYSPNSLFLDIYELNFPGHPIYHQYMQVNAHVNDVFVEPIQNRLYLATDQGIKIFDIDEDEFTPITTLGNQNIHSVYVDDPYLTFTYYDLKGVILHYDIHDITNPRLLSNFSDTIAGIPNRLWGYKNFVYVMVEPDGYMKMNRTESGILTNPWFQNVDLESLEYQTVNDVMYSPLGNIIYLTNFHGNFSLGYYPSSSDFEIIYEKTSDWNQIDAIGGTTDACAIINYNQIHLYSSGLDFDEDGLDNFHEKYIYESNPWVADSSYPSKTNRSWVINSNDDIKYYFPETNQGNSWDNAYIFENIQMTQNSSQPILQIENTTEYVIFRNCTFTTVLGNELLVKIHNTTNIRFENCSFTCPSMIADNLTVLSVSNSENFELINSTLLHGSFTLQDVITARINGNYQNNDNMAMKQNQNRINNGTDIKIEENYLYVMFPYALTVDRFSSLLTIQKNRFVSEQAFIFEGSNSLITNNRHQGAWKGFTVGGESNRIIENEITGEWESAIILLENQAYNTTISDNNISNCGSGIVLQGNNEQIQILSNNITNIGQTGASELYDGYGIISVHGGSSINITHNNITDCLEYAIIILDSNHLEISNNNINKNKVGVFVEGDCVNPIYIFRNVFEQNTLNHAIDQMGCFWDKDNYGNYWGDFDQNSAIQLNGTYWNSSYTIEEYGLDNFPLIDYPWKLPYPGSFMLNSDADWPDTDGTYNVWWTNASEAQNYTLYMKQDTGFINDIPSEADISVDFNASELSYKSDPSFPSGHYYYVVAARNDYGITYSNVLHVWVQKTFNVTVEKQIIEETETILENYTLRWANITGSLLYNIYTSHELNSIIGNGTSLLQAGITKTEYNLGVLPAGDYYFLVEAHTATENITSNLIHIHCISMSNQSNMTLPEEAEIGTFSLVIQGNMNLSALGFSGDGQSQATPYRIENVIFNISVETPVVWIRDSYQYLSFENCTFRTESLNYSLVLIENSKNIQFRQCKFENFDHSNPDNRLLATRMTQNLDIIECDFRYGHVKLEDGVQIRFEGNYILPDDIWFRECLVLNCSNTSIAENYFDENRMVGLVVDESSHHVNIQHNIFLSETALIFSGTESNITQNIFNSTSVWRAIEIWGQNSVIAENQFQNVMETAILVHNVSQGIRIEWNKFYQCGKSIHVQGNSVNLVIHSNEIWDTGQGIFDETYYYGNAISIQNSNYPVTIYNNVIKNSLKCGLFVTGSGDLWIRNNTFERNSKGVIIENDCIGLITIYANVFLNNSECQARDFYSGVKWNNASYGNYWSDYKQEGRDIINGIYWNSPYLIDWYGQDYFPLVDYPWRLPVESDGDDDYTDTTTTDTTTTDTTTTDTTTTDTTTTDTTTTDTTTTDTSKDPATSSMEDPFSELWKYIPGYPVKTIGFWLLICIGFLAQKIYRKISRK